MILYLREAPFEREQTMSAEPQLKPCPFCGGDAVTLEPPNEWASVSCGLCDITMKGSRLSGLVKCWNRRPEEKRLRDIIKRASAEYIRSDVASPNAASRMIEVLAEADKPISSEHRDWSISAIKTR